MMMMVVMVQALHNDDEKKPDNIGNLNDVSEERGLNESFATVLKLEEDKEDTKDDYEEDYNELDDDREESYCYFHRSLLKFRRRAARVYERDEDDDCNYMTLKIVLWA